MFCKLIFGFKRQLKENKACRSDERWNINLRDSGKFYSQNIMKQDKKVLQMNSETL